jgi:putative N6-adenine-specific DNA methylase
MADAAAVVAEERTAGLVTYDAHPDRYAHWRLAFDGPLATLSLDVDEERGIAPGSRRECGFARREGFDAKLWRALRERAREAENRARPVAIFGSDLYGAELAKAREAIETAALDRVVHLKQANLLELSPPAPAGVLVANPPYGVRIGEDAELAAFYPKLGDALKARFAGWRCYFLTADLRLAKLIGLKASKRTPLFNGPLECRLFEYRIVAGALRRPSPAPPDAL